MSWSKSVYSSHVSEVGYDEELGGMTVKFNNGRKVVYEGVPEEDALTAASGAYPSVGNWLNSEIKGRYNFRYI